MLGESLLRHTKATPIMTRPTLPEVSTPVAAAPAASETISFGKWMALTAALLGWLFDGFEMGLFPVVARPALVDLLGGAVNDATISFWNSLVNSSFLVGAATGGVLFGWLGDRLGRVRAMTLSILTYALCSGLGGFAQAPWQMVVIRFIAALGMGGEWSLGVALVMEVWGGRSRALLAGLIGAAANVGYMLVALLSLGLGSVRSGLQGLGLSENWVEWRLLMVCGALPALLTFLIRLFVPESESWEKERDRGATSSWAARDLLAVLAGVGVCAGLLGVWMTMDSVAIRFVATALALVLVAGCYLYPIAGYLSRAGEPPDVRRAIIQRMLLAALISGVPLLATWGAVQWASVWAHQLGEEAVRANPDLQDSARYWKEYTQILSAFGATIGCVLGAAFAGWAGRRIAYVLLCAGSLVTVLVFYQMNTTFDAFFMLTVFLMGAWSAAFYGWLPLYLPELFPTRVRATGQGFGFNFGRIIAAIGVLQVPVLMGRPPNYAHACSALAFIYVLGFIVIWLTPETRGKPLPE
jgi:SHS family sialic acid transporter-like MFS transporter